MNIEIYLSDLIWFLLSVFYGSKNHNCVNCYLMWSWLKSISLLLILQYLKFIRRKFFREKLSFKKLHWPLILELLVKNDNTAVFGKSWVFSVHFHRLMQNYTLQECLQNSCSKDCIIDHEKSYLFNFDKKPDCWYSFLTVFIESLIAFLIRQSNQNFVTVVFFPIH